MNRLDNYVQVHERLERAHDLLQMVVAEPPVMLTDAMGYIRVTVALSDGRSSTGTASFRLDLQGKSAQATNPIEDCETSAIGRALGILGFGSKDGIASREEVQEAQRRQAAPNGHQQPIIAPRRQITQPSSKDTIAKNELISAIYRGISKCESMQLPTPEDTLDLEDMTIEQLAVVKADLADRVREAIGTGQS